MKRNAALLTGTLNTEVFFIHFECSEEDKNPKTKKTSAQIFDSGALYHYKISA